jgi:hypothetical protein
VPSYAVAVEQASPLPQVAPAQSEPQKKSPPN